MSSGSHNVELIAPLINFSIEEKLKDIEEFDLGNDYLLVKIDKNTEVMPLLKNAHVLSECDRKLIMEHSLYAIRRRYTVPKSNPVLISNLGTTDSLKECRRLLGVLRMAFALTKRTHLIFQSFHIDKAGGSTQQFSLNREGSYWDVRAAYPVVNNLGFSKSDLERVKKYFLGLSRLTATDGANRVFNACYYFERARLSDHPNDFRMAFVLFVTSLESLFNTGQNDIGESIANRYTALLYQGTEGEAKKVHDELKEIYSFRSNLVHGNKIQKKYSSKNEQDRLIGNLEFYSRLVLQHILDNDLGEKFNRNDKQLTRYFTTLLTFE